MAKYTTLYDHIYPKIKTSLSDKRNVLELKKVFNSLINSNSDALAATIPSKSIYTNMDMENKIFKFIGVSKDDIKEAIKASPDIPKESDKWRVIKNPVYMATMFLVIYFNNIKNDEMRNQSMFICSLYMYRNVRSKYFKRTSQATISIMEYTLNRLSYKNDLKKYGSILKMIAKKSEVFINNWFVVRKKETVNCVVVNDTVFKLINDNHRRYSTAFNSFYSEFKKDHLEGNFYNVDQDIDTDEKFIASDNVSFEVEKTAQKIANKLSLSGYPDAKLLRQACAIESGCSINNLRTILSYVYDKGLEDFEECVRLIIQTYLFDYKKDMKDIVTPDFIIEMKKFYKKQTSFNDNLTKLKDIIDGFIVKSGLTKKITRIPTLNDCKKATLVYMLLFIQRNI